VLSAVRTEEKGKRSQFRTRVGMDFDPKTTKLYNQEGVDEYLVKNGVHLSLGFEVEFYPQGTDFTLPLPNSDVCMHPQVLALGLKLLLTRFIHSAF